MMKFLRSTNQRINKAWAVVLSAALVLAALSGCGPTDDELSAVSYTPADGEDWEVSTPEAEGLSPKLIARLYYNAENVETITSLLVIKNGKLIAEKYYHNNSRYQKNRLQSVTKSITSALAGIAVDMGVLDIRQKMIEFFPELKNRITDTRKLDITVQQLLEMRAGYPWEESNEELFHMLYSGFRSSYLASVPLAYDPGKKMWYSNLSSHIAGIVISRATGTELLPLAEEYLFGPLGIEPGQWITDWEGHNNGHADLFLTARDMAKFGLLYINSGLYKGRRVLDGDWVKDSLAVHSTDAWQFGIGGNVSKMCYGYFWWSAEAKGYRYSFAWGHGGQEIALIPELDMVVVVTADPQVGNHGDESWKYEKQNLNLVGDFIATLPVH